VSATIIVDCEETVEGVFALRLSLVTMLESKLESSAILAAWRYVRDGCTVDGVRVGGGMVLVEVGCLFVGLERPYLSSISSGKRE